MAEARQYRSQQTSPRSREARVARPDHPVDRRPRCWFRAVAALVRVPHRMAKSSFLVIHSQTRMIIGVRPTINVGWWCPTSKDCVGQAKRATKLHDAE